MKQNEAALQYAPPSLWGDADIVHARLVLYGGPWESVPDHLWGDRAVVLMQVKEHNVLSKASEELRGDRPY